VKSIRTIRDKSTAALLWGLRLYSSLSVERADILEKALRHSFRYNPFS